MAALLDPVLRLTEYLASKKRSESSTKFLSGPHAPTTETEEAVVCEVVGRLPDALKGDFLRLGPNPKLEPLANYHLFDGDGMCHSVRIKGDNTALYSCRYIQTQRLKEEVAAGRPRYIRVGDLLGARGLAMIAVQGIRRKLGLIDMKEGSGGTANTALAYHAGRLMALHEGDVPYMLKVMCDGIIETLYPSTYGGSISNKTFTAHPKKDAATGYLYAFGCSHEAKPYVTFYVIDDKNNFVRSIPIDLPRPIMMHDFIIATPSTKRKALGGPGSAGYAIFLDFPFVFDPKHMIKEGGMPSYFDEQGVSRLGFLPLDATDNSSLKWVNLPKAVFCFHTLNAFFDDEDPNVVHVIFVQYPKMDLSFKDVQSENRSSLYRYTVNLQTGVASDGKQIHDHASEGGAEFPQLRQSLMGQPMRWCYMPIFDKQGFAEGVIKVDVNCPDPAKAIAGKIMFGEGNYGGECPFVPALKEKDDAFMSKLQRSGSSLLDDDEDNGYLVTFVVVSTEGKGATELRVWDAKTMNQEPVAVVKVPRRVPLGFHALHIAEADLALQQKEE